MHITNVTEAKTQLSAILERVRQGEEVVLGKAGRPVAKIVPFNQPTEPRRPGALKGKIKIAEDFDELPDDIEVALGIKD